MATNAVTNAQTALAQWQRIEALVQEWLRERQQLLQLLSTIRSTTQSTRISSQVSSNVKQFCERLMDYISAGYFEVYRELAREARCFQRDNASLTRSIMQQLDDSTDEALAFNDDFDTEEHIAEILNTLPIRLSALLEKLEQRFALEDQLIVSIHQPEVPRQTQIH